MKFIHESNCNKIEFTVDESADLDEVFEQFQNFLRACGYVINYNQVLELVEVDQ